MKNSLFLKFILSFVFCFIFSTQAFAATSGSDYREFNNVKVDSLTANSCVGTNALSILVPLTCPPNYIAGLNINLANSTISLVNNPSVSGYIVADNANTAHYGFYVGNGDKANRAQAFAATTDIGTYPPNIAFGPDNTMNIYGISGEAFNIALFNQSTLTQQIMAGDSHGNVAIFGDAHATNFFTGNSGTTGSVNTQSLNALGLSTFGTPGSAGDNGQSPGVLALGNASGVGPQLTYILSSSDTHNQLNGIQGDSLMITNGTGSSGTLAAFASNGDTALHKLFANTISMSGSNPYITTTGGSSFSNQAFSAGTPNTDQPVALIVQNVTGNGNSTGIGTNSSTTVAGINGECYSVGSYNPQGGLSTSLINADCSGNVGIQRNLSVGNNLTAVSANLSGLSPNLSICTDSSKNLTTSNCAPTVTYTINTNFQISFYPSHSSSNIYMINQSSSNLNGLNINGQAIKHLYVNCVPYNATDSSTYYDPTKIIYGGTINVYDYTSGNNAPNLIGSVSVPDTPIGGPYINHGQTDLSTPYALPNSDYITVTWSSNDTGTSNNDWAYCTAMIGT